MPTFFFAQLSRKCAHAQHRQVFVINSVTAITPADFQNRFSKVVGIFFSAYAVGLMIGIPLQWRYAGPWLGIATAPASLMLGGGVAQQMHFEQTIWAILLGVLVLWALTTLQGQLGANRGQQLVELARPVLGTSVARWTNTAMIALLMMGWASFSTGVAGGSLSRLLGVPEPIGFVLWAGLMFALLWRGIHFGSLIALLGSMATLLLMVWGVIQVNTLGQIVAHSTPSGTFFAGVSLMVGYGAAFSLRCVDFTHALKPGQVIWVSLFGLALPLTVVSFSGAWLFNASGTWDLSLLLTMLGFPGMAHIFVVVGFLGAGISNMHSGSLALQDLTRLPRNAALATVSVVSVVFALLDFEQAMVIWLQFLSVVVVPLVGVMLTHYAYGLRRLARVNWMGILAWGSGSLAGTVAPQAYPKAVVGVVVAAMVYGVAVRISSLK